MITLGADPELFLQRNDSIISAIGMVGGSKYDPKPVSFGAVQEDNVLAEFNIDPAANESEFIHNIKAVTDALKDIVLPCTLVAKASHDFTKEEIKSAGPKALEFGCDPDLNCWSVELNKTPSPYTTLRTAGGHVHIGYDGAELDQSLLVARMCEFLLGVPSVLLDGDERRRELYGSAGAIRLKAYGIEYRVLSNFWVASEYLQRWVYKQSVLAVETRDTLEYFLSKYSSDVVQGCINSSDKGLALEIVNELEIILP